MPPPHSIEPSSSRLSLAAPSEPSLHPSSTAHRQNGAATSRGSITQAAKYPISSVLAEPSSSSSLLPTLALPSASSYLPSQLSAFSTTFTSAGNLPRSAIAAGGKSVAQRRSQAPPIVVTELRRVGRAEFEGYLGEVGGEWERWERELKEAAREGLADDDEDEQDGEELGLGLANGTRAGSSETTRTKQQQQGRKRKKKTEESLPPLDDVPSIFFDASFNLSNPRTFDIVTERILPSPPTSPIHRSHSHSLPAPSFPPRTASSPGNGPSSLTSLAADEALQDKLSHYTALIESHLVREIGLRSASFFAALSNLQSLHTQGEDTLVKIAELQSALKAEEGGVGSAAKHGLEILRAQARRRGLEKVEESVRAVEEVWSAVEGVKELVENGEWEGALEVSEGVEEAYFGSSLAAASSSSSTTKRPLNLTKLTSLASLPIKLSLLRAQIAKSLEGELISVLEHEMDAGIEEHIKASRSEAGGGNGGWKGAQKEGPAARASTAASLLTASAHSSSSASSTVALPPLAASGALQDVPEEEEAPEAQVGEVSPSPEKRARERATERVRPVVRALVRAEGMDSAVAAWRESVLREVRALVREHLPTTGENGGEDDDPFAQAAIRSVGKQSIDLGTISEKSISLAKKLRSLSHDTFFALAQETYLGLLACINVVDLQARVLLELTAEAREEERLRKARRRKGVATNGGEQQPQQPPPSTGSSSSLTVPGSVPPSPSSLLASTNGHSNGDSRTSTSSDDSSSTASHLLLSTEIADVVHAVSELANVRFSKVLGVRTESHSHLPLEQFVALFDLTWSFVVACEVVCQRMIVGLRGAIVSQAKAWLQIFHQRRITDSAKVVEEEQWSAVEVGRERQRVVERIVESAMRDPPALLLGDRRKGEGKDGENGEGIKDGEEGRKDEPAKQVEVEGRQFFAVGAGLTTIGVLVEYLMVLLNCPMLTTDCMSKIIEFMKAFNSRTCQVVLGAGAMRSAGLKNITAKHLALASQALSIMVALIPYIRECVRRHLNPKQAVMLTEFDKLKRDYQEHQHEIHAKLVAIMSDRLQVHSRTMETTNWEEPSDRPGLPGAYMESLVKEHLTLHKVLSRFLAPETVAQILGQVFTALDARLAEIINKTEIRTSAAQVRLLVDVRYLREKLRELKGLEGQGPARDLEPLIEAKHLPQPPSSPRPNLPPRTSSMAPSASPFPSPNRPSAAAAALGTATPPTPSISPLPQASTSTTSLALPDAPSAATADSPRTSFESHPPSPVPIPQPLPPTPASAGPAPYVKKSLADRLAERMGRKPSIEASRRSVEEPRKSVEEGRKSVELEPRTAEQPQPAVPVEPATKETEKEERIEKVDDVVVPTIVEPTSSPPPAAIDFATTTDAVSLPSPPLESSSDSPSSSLPPPLPADVLLSTPTADLPLSTPALTAALDTALEFTALPTDSAPLPLPTPLREEVEAFEESFEKQRAEEERKMERREEREMGALEELVEEERNEEMVEEQEHAAEVEKKEDVDTEKEEEVEAKEPAASEQVDLDVAIVAVDVVEPLASSIDAETALATPAAEEQEQQTPAPSLTEHEAVPAATLEDPLPSADVVPAVAELEATPAVDLAPVVDKSTPDSAAAPDAAPVASSVSTPTTIDLPPAIPVVSTDPSPSLPTPVAESSPASPAPSAVPAPSPSPSPAATTTTPAPPPEPPRRKTLKERLAEAAQRRGSLGGSLLESPPPPAVVVDAQGKEREVERELVVPKEKEEEVAKEGEKDERKKNEEKEQGKEMKDKDKEVVGSPEAAEKELPPKVDAVKEDQAETKETTTSTPPEAAVEGGEDEVIEEQDGSFL